MNRFSCRYRPMRRSRYQRLVAELKQAFPWVGDCLKPAPGHLELLHELLCDVESALNHEQRQAISLFGAVEFGGYLSVTLSADSLGRTLVDTVTLLVRGAEHRSCDICTVCGRRSSGLLIPGKVTPGFCASHVRVRGRFAEELRQKRVPAICSEGDASRSTQASELSPADQPACDAPALAALVADLTDPKYREPEEPAVRVLSMKEVGQFKEARSHQKSEQSQRAAHIARRIEQAGGALRWLGILRQPWSLVSDEFESRFPNFHALAELLRDHLALNALGDHRIALPPVLLIGPAGIGKTEAAHWLANRLDLPYRCFDMSTVQSNSQLTGSEAFWSNSTEGGVFELIAFGKKANPIVVVDELDKCSADARFDPMASFYTLLEPRTAREFRDLSIPEIALDASHINWVATANSLDSIPAPIRSRFVVLQVSAPNREQSRCIAQCIYRRLRDQHEWGAKFPDELSEAALARLTDTPPRGMRITLQRAFGAAARQGRSEVQPADLLPAATERRRGIGFTASHHADDAGGRGQ